ncbi:unnamed protein product [Brachionus calyciflorus]|uniref:Protein kinase domain-containing protein n=1 Tax=Brachionus calyciflorus TaxID=104777 RepID=A0A813VKT0_9BILA|nr:unnamed protein product [Brachionus calyciflorus]
MNSDAMGRRIELEPDSEPAFECRQITIRKEKWVTDEFEMLEFLGRGKFGEVKRCKEKATGRLLAAKFVSIIKEQERKDVYNEIEIMKSLQHPRLIQLYDVYENPSKKQMCLILELINGGELFERVIDDNFILTERLCELYILQICEGLNFMHKSNILHLDLKPENILCLSKDGHRLKIIDFGLARRFNPAQALKVLFGTPEFVAPEVVSYDKIGYGTDMWSVGVICYVLLSGLSPFMGDNDCETYNNITRAEFDFDDESFVDISDEAKDFINKLLVKDLNKRMLASQSLNHPWLNKSITPTAQPLPDDKIINTKNLRRFVIRRRWQKAVNALLALKRLGLNF